MKPIEYFEKLVKAIHMTVMSTVDKEGFPYTCAVDMMDYDENGLYFLTSRGKALGQRILDKKFVALTGIKGDDTMASYAISVRGKVRETGKEFTEILFNKNPYMYEIFPTEKSRNAIVVFQIYSGTGEWFEISDKGINKIDFSFGGEELIPEGYAINVNKCIACGKCNEACPRFCIEIKDKAEIILNKCIRCGNCQTACPTGAIFRL